MHHNNIPAILFPFTSQDGVLKGYYVRYMLELEIKSLGTKTSIIAQIVYFSVILLMPE